MKISKTAKSTPDVIPAYPAYAIGQAGFDAKQGRFRAANGQRISKADFMASANIRQVNGKYVANLTEDSPGGRIELDMAQQSHQMERIESLIGFRRNELFGSEDTHLTTPGKIMADALNPPMQAWPIPPSIRAAMILSEFFMRTEGDLFHALTLPIELSVTEDFQIRSTSKDIKREWRELYDVDNLNFSSLIRAIMLSLATYSNAFCFEAEARLETGDPANDSPIAGIAMLQPRNTYVGAPITFWNQTMGAPATSNEYGIISQTEKPWTVELLQSELPPLAYHALAPNFNESNQMLPGRWVPLPKGSTTHLTDFKLPWERYANPHLSRAFRSLTKRKTYDELERATMEGYKNQLWVFNVGNDKELGQPKEVEMLKAAIGGLAGERTGNIAWRGNLHVDVKAPNNLQGILNQDTYMGLTANVFRNVGIVLRLISGETQGRPGSGDIDVRVFIERLRYQQKKIIEFERAFRLRWGKRFMGKMSDKAMQELRDTTVVFMKPMVELEEQVSKIVVPMLMSGKLSNRTVHEMMNVDHDVEVERKKQEQTDGEDELFMAQPVYSQVSTDPQGNSTTHSTNKRGGDNAKEQSKEHVKGAKDDGGRDPSDYAPFYSGY